MRNANYLDYQVFENGDVYTKDGKRKRLYQVNRDGYYGMILMINGKRKVKYVHRMLAELFIPNPENKPQINHINGIKKDNRLENLEWCTISENIKHSFATGLRRNKNSICVIQYDQNNNIINEYKSIREAARLNRYDGKGISRCIKGKIKHYNKYIWKSE